MQVIAPEVEKVPAGHGVAAAFLHENPAGQDATHAVAPAAEKVLAGQDVEAVVVHWLPAAHFLHEVAPLVVE